MKSLFKAVAVITIFSVLTRLAGFLFRIYLSRAIGPENLGLYQIAFSVFIVLLTLISSGLPLTISKLSAKYTTENDKLSKDKLVFSGLIIGAITSIILLLIILAFNRILSSVFTDDRCIYILISLLPAVVFSSVYSVFRGSLWGEKKYIAVCGVELFEQIFRIIVCVCFVSLFFTGLSGAVLAGWSLSIACFFSALFVTIVYFKSGGRIKPNTDKFKEILSSSTPITGVRVASSLIQPLVAIIIPLRLVASGWTNAQALTQFGIAMGMTFPLLYVPSTLVGSLSMALLPDLSAALACKNENYIKHRVKYSINLALFVSSICVPVFMALGEPICEILFDSTAAGTYLSRAAWIMIPISLCGLTSTILNAFGLEVKSFKNYIIGAIIMIACIWFLPPICGIYSLVYGMGACTTIASILNIIMINKSHLKGESFLKSTLIYLALILPTTLLTANLFNLFIIIFPKFISLCICGGICSLTYLILCNIFKVISIESFYIEISKKYPITQKLKFLNKKKVM